jgi:exopolyphosphatase / guanosine-5'-triphosphate,3'-diphosphate pyrophosphatase
VEDTPLTSAPIVPRWEWRTFAERFGTADDQFDALAPESVEESDELYLLPLQRDASVKIRAGLLDVKELVQVSDDGLEQWRPVMKAEFPLSAEDVGAVFEALGASAPTLARATYTLDELVDELVGPSPDVSPVPLHKRREHYEIGGCMAERSEFSTDRATIRTIAAESEDPSLVTKTVCELALNGLPNVNVPRGLRTLVGFGA